MARFTTYVSSNFSLPGYFYNATPSQVISASNSEIALIAPGGDTQLYQGSFSYYSNGALNWYGSTLSGLIENTPGGVEVGRLSGLSIPGYTYYSYASNNDFSGLKSYVFGGNDLINGSAFSDTLYGYTGNDAIYGNSGNDFLGGDAGNDYIDGGIGFDTLVGGIGDDELSGALNGDALYGEDGNDLLRGGNGLDLLNGGAGNDTLIGALGTDTLTGGTGSDAFRFTSVLDGHINIDTITDYVSGTDQIQLSASVFSAFANQVGQSVGLGEYINYNQSTGALSYDSDGFGIEPSVQFATIGTATHPALTNDHFLIIG